MHSLVSSFFSDQEQGDEYPICVVFRKDLEAWLQKQSSAVSQWLARHHFISDRKDMIVVPRWGEDSGGFFVLLVLSEESSLVWKFSKLVQICPVGRYKIDSSLNDAQLYHASLGWGMGSYHFDLHKESSTPPQERGNKIPCLLLPSCVDQERLTTETIGVIICRDLINTAPNHMMPRDLSLVFEYGVKLFTARCRSYTNESLLTHNFPLVYAVGKGSKNHPRLFDFTWGDEKNPHITIVGKGVCFDSGGLDIKPSSGMRLMKKDMGGAAHAIALGYMIASCNLPVYLRVIVPAVENAVSGNAYRPGDVIQSREGSSVEITNTDAEGRLVLADALTLACEDEKLELLIDFATLTGASRVALGAEIPSLFSNDDALAKELEVHAKKQEDPVWHMPLYKPYAKMLKSSIADIRNCVVEHSYGGAITAALFLEKFVKNVPWLHLDVMAWNIKSEEGRIMGGEAQGVRALFSYILDRYLPKS